MFSPLCLSFCLSFCLLFCLSVYLFIYLSIYLLLYCSIYSVVIVLSINHLFYPSIAPAVHPSHSSVIHSFCRFSSDVYHSFCRSFSKLHTLHRVPMSCPLTVTETFNSPETNTDAGAPSESHWRISSWMWIHLWHMCIFIKAAATVKLQCSLRLLCERGEQLFNQISQ